MSKKPSFEAFKAIYEDEALYPRSGDVGRKFGVKDRAVRRWAEEFRADGLDLKERGSGSPLDETTVIIAERCGIKELIHGLNDVPFDVIPDWTQAPSETLHKYMQGIPLLFLSDFHFDEVVDPSQINFVNSYNREIATRRIQYTFDSALKILTKCIDKPFYDGIIVCLGGDLLSGNILDELRESNEFTILQSVVALTQLLIDGLKLYVDHFGKVHVPCVVGNHGRLDKKPRAKNKVFDNFEWLIYQYLAKYFKDDERITFQIPDGPDCLFKVYDKTFLLTHGDQFKSGESAGLLASLHSSMLKKQKKHFEIKKPFDVMMVANFHQYIHTSSIVVNGSLRGYDEYANISNFSFEPPQQALWINHYKRGMIFRTPIGYEEQPDVHPKKI